MNEMRKQQAFDPTSVSQLFRLCEQPDEDSVPSDPNHARKLLLRDLLSDVPPLNEQVLQGIPALLKQLHRNLPRREGQSLDELLQDPKASIESLCIIKEYAKRATQSAQNEGAYEVAGVVYYAAIAAALVRHDIRITQHSFEQLRDSFSTLLAKNWLTSELRQLLEQAENISKQRE